MSVPIIGKIDVLGIQLSKLSKLELITSIGKLVESGKKSLILSGNIYSFNLSFEQPWLKKFLNSADIIRIDGAGVRLGAKILGHDTPPRMTWADFAWDLAELVEDNQYTMYFLGGKPGVAQQAASEIRKRHPRILIVGAEHGYFNKGFKHPENKDVIARLNEIKPDILVVGFGMPLQEKWLSENWDKLNLNVIMTGGAVFDYISGNLQRAPDILTNNGFEWLGRLLIEPKRLWRRYVIGNPQFLFRVLKQKAFQRA